MRHLSRFSTLALTLIAGAGVASCAFLMDLGVIQCSADGDCAHFGQDFVCAESSCRKKATVNNGEGGQTEAGPPPCASNNECITKAGGEPAVCNHGTGQCVALKSETCGYVVNAEGLANDNAVVLGAFFSLYGGPALAQALPRAYGLALEEIAVAGGVPDPPRPFVAVYCASETDKVEAGVRHLVNEVHVPALVSLFSPADTPRLFDEIIRPGGTFMLNPQDTTDALRHRDSGRMLWHLLGTPEDVGVAYRPLLSIVENYALNPAKSPWKDGVGALAIPAKSDLRIATVTIEYPTEESLLSVVRDPDPAKGVSINGKPIITYKDNLTGNRYLSVKVPAGDNGGNPQYGSFVTQLAAFKPDIVIMLTADEAAVIAPPLDAALQTAGARLPIYVLSMRNADSLSAYIAEPDATAKVEKMDAKLKRYIGGLQYAGAPDKFNPASQYQRWLQRMQERYQAQSVPESSYSWTENYYDSFYWLAYALRAAGPGAPSTGASFSEGMRKLILNPAPSPDAIIHPGSTTTIGEAFFKIGSFSQGVMFEGTAGPPVFDSAIGAAISVGATYCLVPVIEGGKRVMAPQYDRLRYDVATKKFRPTDVWNGCNTDIGY